MKTPIEDDVKMHQPVNFERQEHQLDHVYISLALYEHFL